MGYERSAHLYDLFDDKPNIEFFARYAGEVAEILDVGAGTGRIAIALAEAGTSVVCVEPSAAMRREFRKKLERNKNLASQIDLIPGDAVSFDLARTFAAAYLSGVFDHFPDRGQRLAALRNTVRHLRPGGILVFDTFLGMMRASASSPAGRVRDGEREYRRFVSRRILPGRLVEVRLVFDTCVAGELVNRIEERSLVGVVTRGEVHSLLSEVNATVRYEYSDYDRTPFQGGDGLLIVEAVCHPR